jgi:hypothetical protein
MKLQMCTQATELCEAPKQESTVLFGEGFEATNICLTRIMKLGSYVPVDLAASACQRTRHTFPTSDSIVETEPDLLVRLLLFADLPATKFE